LKVAFDSRPLTNPDGVGRYTTCLLEQLRNQLEVVEDHRPRQADLYHSPWLEGALLRSPCPMVVTVHDLAALKRPGERLRAVARMQLRYLAVQRAARVIVPTEAVALDVVEHLGIERRRIAVIPEAPAPQIHRRSEREVASLRSRLGLPERYLLWVGDLRRPAPHRQLIPLAQADRRMPLVLAGPAGRWAYELPNVILTGQLSDGDLAALYTGAHALVLPSEEEGFGLVTLEALACGTPVVACDLPSLREVLGQRATFVPRGELDRLVAAAEAATRPAPPPPPWSWEDTARATVAVYAEAIADAQRGCFPLLGATPPLRASAALGPRDQ